MKKFNKKPVLAVLAISLVLGLTGFVIAATQVNLGAADDFAILAGSGITIGGAVNTSTITGDIGSFSTATITGIGYYSPCQHHRLFLGYRIHSCAWHL